VNENGCEIMHKLGLIGHCVLDPTVLDPTLPVPDDAAMCLPVPDDAAMCLPGSDACAAIAVARLRAAEASSATHALRSNDAAASCLPGSGACTAIFAV